MCLSFLRVLPVCVFQTPAGGTTDNLPMSDYSTNRSHNVQIQLPNGNTPGDDSASSFAAGSGGNIAINISEEVNRSGVWKNVNIGNILPSEKPTCRSNRRRGK